MTAMFKIYFTLMLVFLGSKTVFGQNCTNPKILQTCYLNYFKNLNITTTGTTFPAYNNYLNVFNAYNTQARLSQFCSYVYDLTKCLEATNDACLSPEGFMGLNITGEDAYDYPTNYGIIQYTCGDGLDAWKKIINCTTQNSQAINEANTKCEQAFEKTDQSSCSNLVTFLKCTYVLLKQDCGADAYTFACKADKNGIKYSTPSCVSSMIDCSSDNSNFAVMNQLSFITLLMFAMFCFLML